MGGTEVCDSLGRIQNLIRNYGEKKTSIKLPPLRLPICNLIPSYKKNLGLN